MLSIRLKNIFPRFLYVAILAILWTSIEACGEESIHPPTETTPDLTSTDAMPDLTPDIDAAADQTDGERCDLMYPVLGCPCTPYRPCCVPHKRPLDRWLWRYGYVCGHWGQPDEERVWEKYDYPRADDLCVPGACDPANYHECDSCPPFWPYYDGVNYRGGPSQEDCAQNPNMEGCPCGLQEHCCVFDKATEDTTLGAWLCTSTENSALNIRSWVWLPVARFDCEIHPTRWQCTDCTSCNPDIGPGDSQ